jgi:hypothetical protein
MTSADIDVITATIPRFREISGIGRSKIYELLDAGELESVHLGARRLIVIDSYRRLLGRLQREQAGERSASAEAEAAMPAAEITTARNQHPTSSPSGGRGELVTNYARGTPARPTRRRRPSPPAVTPPHIPPAAG